MHRLSLKLLSLGCCLAYAVVGGEVQAAAPAKEELTAKGATWGFFGDSITHMGTYHQFIQIYLATHYPGRDLWTVNLGRSGDTTWGAVDARLERELSTGKFDFVFIHFGMNDVGGFRFKENGPPPEQVAGQEKRRTDYRSSLNTIVEAVKAKGAVPILLSPTIYDNEWKNGPGHSGGNPAWNRELRHFSEIAKEVAEEHGVLFIDVITPMEEITAAKQAEDPAFTLIGPDRIHPKSGGDEVMACVILKALGLETPVYEIALQADGSTVRQINAEVSGASATADSLSFKTVERALPFPVLERDAGVDYTNFVSEQNPQMLLIEGLGAGDWTLHIDGQPVGNYTSNQLAEGVNFSTNNKTPQYAKALELRALLQGAPSTFFNAEERSLEFRKPDDLADKELAEQLIRTLQPSILPRKEIRMENDVSEEQWATQSAEILEKIVANATAHQDRTGKPLGGWPGFVVKTSREHLANLYVYRDRVREIRRQLAQTPATFEHSYQLKLANP